MGLGKDMMRRSHVCEQEWPGLASGFQRNVTLSGFTATRVCAVRETYLEDGIPHGDAEARSTLIPQPWAEETSRDVERTMAAFTKDTNRGCG